MTEIRKRCALVAGGVLLLVACGRENKPAEIPPIPPPEPASTLAPAAGPTPSTGPRCVQNFKLFDKDGDGMVSQSEFMAREHWRADPQQIFDARDQDGDGVLTEEEFCSGPRGRDMPAP